MEKMNFKVSCTNFKTPFLMIDNYQSLKNELHGNENIWLLKGKCCERNETREFDINKIHSLNECVLKNKENIININNIDDLKKYLEKCCLLDKIIVDSRTVLT